MAALRYGFYSEVNFHSSFSYQGGSWNKPRRVVAKVEWHHGEFCPRVGFILSNLARSAERVVAFYNHRGTCEQYIKEGKGAIKWSLSCRSFAANAARLARRRGASFLRCRSRSGWPRVS
jgi:hypothetical protein